MPNQVGSSPRQGLGWLRAGGFAPRFIVLGQTERDMLQGWVCWCQDGAVCSVS